MQIVVNNKDDSKLVEMSEGEFIEPAFLQKNKLFLSDSHCLPTMITDKLAHKITRFPNDLRSHIQRIFIFIEHKKNESVYSSLIDLFLVLGDKGAALRKRMLSSAQFLLSETQFSVLSQSFSSDSFPQSSLVDISQSVLSSGNNSGMPFILKVDESEDDINTIIDEARSYLEYGQLGEAINALQEAVITYPNKLELQYDLLEIFQKTHDKAGFIDCYEQLIDKGLYLPPLWQQLAKEFGYEKY